MEADEVVTKESRFVVMISNRLITTVTADLQRSIKNKVWEYIFKRHQGRKPGTIDLIGSGETAKVEIPPQLPEGLLGFRFILANTNNLHELSAVVAGNFPRNRGEALVLFFVVNQKESIPILADLHGKFMRERPNQLVLTVMKMGDQFHCFNWGEMRGLGVKHRKPAQVSAQPKS